MGKLIPGLYRGTKLGERMSYIPERGDVVWITYTPNAGNEQVRIRPALILSPQAYNRRVSLALMCPITSQIKGYPFEVSLPEECEVVGVILADQVKSLDWRARQAELRCQIPAQTIAEVLAKLNTLLS
jgi:mRNA interferase MazF